MKDFNKASLERPWYFFFSLRTFNKCAVVFQTTHHDRSRLTLFISNGIQNGQRNIGAISNEWGP